MTNMAYVELTARVDCLMVSHHKGIHGSFRFTPLHKSSSTLSPYSCNQHTLINAIIQLANNSNGQAQELLTKGGGELKVKNGLLYTYTSLFCCQIRDISKYRRLWRKY